MNEILDLARNDNVPHYTEDKTMKSLSAVIAALAAIACISLTSPTGAATVTGQNGFTASAYPNLLAGSTATGGGTGINQITPAPGVEDDNAYARLRKDSAGNPTDGYFQYTATSPFTAGTVVSWRPVGGGGAGTLGNAHVKLGATEVQNLPDNDCKVVTTTLPEGGITTDTVRIEYPNGLGVYNATTSISDINEIQVFPDRLSLITGITVTDNSPVYWSSPSAMFDDLMNNGWFPSAQTSPARRYVELDLGDTRTVGVIVIDAEGGADPLDLQYWTGSAWTTFANVTYAANEIIALKIDGGVTTSQLRLDLGSGANMRGYQEALLFEVLAPAIPEPASLALLGLGLLLTRRQRG